MGPEALANRALPGHCRPMRRSRHFTFAGRLCDHGEPRRYAKRGRARPAYHIHCENLRSTVARVVKTDFEIILDLVLRDTVEFDACLRALSPRPTCVVRVWAPISVLEAREQTREDRGVGMAREQFEHPAYKRTYDFEVDTSTCTAAQGAAAIRAFMAAQRLTGQCNGPPAAAAD
jgi:chloramphenicol 3-O-phosphotransferase